MRSKRVVLTLGQASRACSPSSTAFSTPATSPMSGRILTAPSVPVASRTMPRASTSEDAHAHPTNHAVAWVGAVELAAVENWIFTALMAELATSDLAREINSKLAASSESGKRTRSPSGSGSGDSSPFYFWRERVCAWELPGNGFLFLAHTVRVREQENITRAQAASRTQKRDSSLIHHGLNGILLVVFVASFLLSIFSLSRGCYCVLKIGVSVCRLFFFAEFFSRAFWGSNSHCRRDHQTVDGWINQSTWTDREDREESWWRREGDTWLWLGGWYLVAGFFLFQFFFSLQLVISDFCLWCFIAHFSFDSWLSFSFNIFFLLWEIFSLKKASPGIEVTLLLSCRNSESIEWLLPGHFITTT